MVYLAKHAGDGKIFDVVQGKEYQPVPLGIGVSKSDPKLRDALQAALNAIIRDGTYMKILDKYGVQSGAVQSASINGGSHLAM